MTTARQLERYWVRRARRLAGQVNLGWWVRCFLPLLCGWCLLCAAALLVVRRAGDSSSTIWLALAGGLVLGAVVAWILSRQRLFTRADALARLDLHLHLYSRLTAAAAGIGDWPDPPSRPVQAFSWQWRRVAIPVVACGLLLLAAGFVPVPIPGASAGYTIQEPLAWTQMTAWIEELKEEDIVREDDLKELEEKLGALREQSRDQWYSHSSMEEGDSLRDQTEQNLRFLKRDLELSAAALAAARDFSDQLTPMQLEALNQELRKALEGLQLGALKLDDDLLRQLQNMDLSKLKFMTPDQYEQLRQKLCKGAQTCGACVGLEDSGVVVAALGQRPGAGGVDRGPGAAPLTMNESRSELGTTKTQAVSNPDLERAAIGDVVGMGAGEHKVDTALYQGPVVSGAIQNSGAGGETVWRNPLLPEERDVLKKYFK